MYKMCRSAERPFRECGLCVKLKWIFAQHLRTSHASRRVRLKVVFTDGCRQKGSTKIYRQSRGSIRRSKSNICENLLKVSKRYTESKSKNHSPRKCAQPRRRANGSSKKALVSKKIQTEWSVPYCVNLGVGRSGKTEYKCTECGFRSCFRSSIRRHHRRVHLKEKRLDTLSDENVSHQSAEPEVRASRKNEHVQKKDLSQKKTLPVFDSAQSSAPSLLYTGDTAGVSGDLTAAIAFKTDIDTWRNEPVSVIPETSGKSAQSHVDVFEEINFLSTKKPQDVEQRGEINLSAFGGVKCQSATASLKDACLSLHTDEQNVLKTTGKASESKPCVDNKTRNIRGNSSSSKDDGSASEIVCFKKTKSDETGKVKYTCVECDYTDLHKFLIKRHYSEVHADFSCQVCRTSFNERSALKKHVAKNKCKPCKDIPYCKYEEVDGVRKYQCQACPFVSAYGGYMKRHYENVHIKNLGRFPCHLCDMAFEQKRPLYIHLLQHSGGNWSQQNSMAKLESGSKLQHLDAKGTGVSKPVCEICNKKYANLSLLVDHMNVHNGKTPHLCDICGRSFAEKKALVDHLRVHADIRPLKCDVCPKTFRDLSSLERHKNTHAGIKPFSCEYCGKGFTDKGNLKVHVRIHTGEKPFGCELCNYRSGSSTSIKLHMISVHSNERKLKCQYCDRCFKLSSSLRAHERRHVGDKRHKCSFCDKAFIEKSSLKEHTLVHTNVRQYGCMSCKMMFKRRDTVVQHIRSQHPSVPADRRTRHVFDAEKANSPDIDEQMIM